MQPKITVLEQTLLLGMRMKMTVSNDKARELWQKFLPHREQINNRVGANFYSVQNYDPNIDFEDFTTDTLYEKWASVAVSDLQTLPAELESLILERGQYAVFKHRGPASTFPETWKYIFWEWLPNSEYELDKRPHFEILTPAYRPDDPNAEEEIWIPIK